MNGDDRPSEHRRASQSHAQELLFSFVACIAREQRSEMLVLHDKCDKVGDRARSKVHVREPAIRHVLAQRNKVSRTAIRTRRGDMLYTAFLEK